MYNFIDQVFLATDAGCMSLFGSVIVKKYLVCMSLQVNWTFAELN